MTIKDFIDNSLLFVEREKEFLKESYEEELDYDVESVNGMEVIEWLKQTCHEMVNDWFKWENL